MDVPRGAIRQRQFANQVKDYSGLRYGNITPTDIDGHIEYKDLGFVLIETKFGDAPMPYGQRLALERECDDHTKPTLLVLTKHESTGDIDMAATSVIEFRFRGIWRKPDTETTLKELVDRFIHWLEFSWQLQNTALLCAHDHADRNRRSSTAG